MAPARRWGIAIQKSRTAQILHCGATVLGNTKVGKGAVITAKSIVTKEVPERARVSGVPATVKSYRALRGEGYQVDLTAMRNAILIAKYQVFFSRS